MKAELNAMGELLVTAETPVEQYALKSWGKDYFSESPDEPCSFGVDWGQLTETRVSPTASPTIAENRKAPIDRGLIP